MLAVCKNLAKNLKPKNGDGIDRLNSVLTSSMLAILIIFLGSHYYLIYDPIQCWMPEQMTKDNWEKYVEDYCYVQNTYFVSFENDTNLPEAERHKYEQKYYYWVPLILIVQFFLFLIPNAIWNYISKRTGLNAKTILAHAKDSSSEPSPHKLINAESWAAAKYIHEIIFFNCRRKIRLFGIFPSKTYNEYFTATYLYYKFLNCLNSFAQFLILNQFLSESYTFGGFGLLRDLLIEKDWKLTGHFPRVTFCDVSIRDDASDLSMNFTVQCVLPNNMFNEKIYIILWFWFAALTALNFINLFYWIYTSMYFAWKMHFIKAQLQFPCLRFARLENGDVLQFLQEWLKVDGLTALRLISANSGDFVSSDILGAMYLDFVVQRSKKAEENGKYISSFPLD
uniref:Innexin n=1 Tax=Panagrolaimus sp. PS1159 TaxID=55785 RepID=A0AC35FMH1_9BILA